MEDEELRKQLVELDTQLKKISKNTGTPLWKSFVTGTLTGLGGVIGVAIALTIIGWVLNVVGVIPAFKHQVTIIEQDLNNLRK